MVTPHPHVFMEWQFKCMDNLTFYNFLVTFYESRDVIQKQSLTLNWEIFGSNFGRDIAYPDWGFFVVFLHGGVQMFSRLQHEYFRFFLKLIVSSTIRSFDVAPVRRVIQPTPVLTKRLCPLWRQTLGPLRKRFPSISARDSYICIVFTRRKAFSHFYFTIFVVPVLFIVRNLWLL
jgi:hypothetical protein